MVQLNASTLSSVKMARGVAPKTERVIQFGEGGFLRAFCDWMIDMANEKAGMDAGVVIVQPIERGMVSMLNEQDGLYTLILRGQVDGKPSKDERIIQSVKRGLSPYEDFEGYLALAHNPDMRIIISNTTEAGIVYTGKDSFDDKPQASYPGKLTRLLYERFTAFGGKKGTGFILLPCELNHGCNLPRFKIAVQNCQRVCKSPRLARYSIAPFPERRQDFWQKEP